MGRTVQPAPISYSATYLSASPFEFAEKLFDLGKAAFDGFDCAVEVFVFFPFLPESFRPVERLGGCFVEYFAGFAFGAVRSGNTIYN